MSNCIETNAFHIKLIKTGFVANDKLRQPPGFDLRIIAHVCAQNSSDEFNIEHCPIKFDIFHHLIQYKLSSPCNITAWTQCRKIGLSI